MLVGCDPAPAKATQGRVERLLPRSERGTQSCGIAGVASVIDINSLSIKASCGYSVDASISDPDAAGMSLQSNHDSFAEVINVELLLLQLGLVTQENTTMTLDLNAVAQLNAAMAVAIYEQIGILHDFKDSSALSPMAFASSSSPDARVLEFSIRNVLASEILLNT